MPTATTTIVRSDVDSMTSSVVALKTSSSTQVAESSTAATLRSLYPRAAKAFLQRDIALTHSLLTSAFALLVPPLYAGEDELSVHRRKWDILRITLETTVYASPPPSADPKGFPAALRANQMLSSQSLITSLHDRSLQLFTPNNPPTRPSPFFIPHQILVTLVLASVKLGCPEVGKSMIEDWLARKNPDVLSSDEGRLGYIKILELYCLHILPRLEEWEYAQDFLQYERELEPEMRATMITTIRQMHSQAIAAREAKSNRAAVVPSPSPSSSRSISPARSNASDSSSSTHTATPRTPRPTANVNKGKGKAKERGRAQLNGLTSLTPSPQLSPSISSSSSQSITSNTTSRTVTPASVVRNRQVPEYGVVKSTQNGHAQNGHALTSNGHAGTLTPIPRPPRSSSVRPPTTVSAPSTLALVRSYVQSLLQTMSKSKLTALFLLFVVFPIISFVIRARRRRITGGLTGPGGTADAVRRRLRAANQGVIGVGFAQRIWEEAVRAVSDTVRMGGRGLV